jgi:hypothetical protein
MIETVRESVNANSPLEIVEEAFVCLQKFVGQISYSEGEIRESLTDDGGMTLYNL